MQGGLALRQKKKKKNIGFHTCDYTEWGDSVKLESSEVKWDCLTTKYMKKRNNHSLGGSQSYIGKEDSSLHDWPRSHIYIVVT